MKMGVKFGKLVKFLSGCVQMFLILVSTLGSDCTLKAEYITGMNVTKLAKLVKLFKSKI